MHIIRIALFAALAAVFAGLPQNGAAQTAPRWDQVTDWNKPPRREDHFFRNRIRRRIDLQEKVNAPLAYKVGHMYDAESRLRAGGGPRPEKFQYRKGVIMALIAGFAEGKYVAVKPDSLDVRFSFDAFRAGYDKETDAERAETYSGEDGGGAFGEDDPFGDFGGGFDEEFGTFDEDVPDEPVEDIIPMGRTSDALAYDKMTPNLELIEDRIFDENKGALHYEIKYLILSVNNAAGQTTPLAAFRYDEVKDAVLDKCQWTNRRNDAAHLTAKEVLENRHFNSVIIDLSGFPSLTVDEAEQRRRQLAERESYNWTY